MFRAVACALLLSTVAPAVSAATPLRLHPDNPHYFLWRGRPTVLITSGEHYGAVLNLDFDFRKYLDTLASDGLNLTRTFTGVYCEPPGAFNIASNTLAPAPGQLICPWARSDQPGYRNGGNKFDLRHWDTAYFKRLKEFMDHAARRGVVVELNLFCPFYRDAMWELSPMNIRNNVNGVGAIARTNVYTLDKHGGLLPYQEALVRKLVTELQDYDNLYYEICNEPYFGGVTMEWQRHMADVITETERRHGVRHLISQNIANGRARVDNPHPRVSILNFHYAYPPDAVALNYHLDRVIGDNETGFRGTNDLPYRIEAWSFLLAGGGLFNHLDYSFTVGREDGTFAYPKSQPGGGNAGFRRQMRVLAEFMHRLDFIHMQPNVEWLTDGVPAKHRAYGLSQPGQAYALYLARDPREKSAGVSKHRATLTLRLTPATYTFEWIEPLTGRRLQRGTIQARQSGTTLTTPEFTDDLALRLQRR